MLKRPESEILANFFADMGEKCGEHLAKNFADFRQSISRKSGRKKFNEKSSTKSTSHETKILSPRDSGSLGAQGLSPETLLQFLGMCPSKTAFVHRNVHFAAGKGIVLEEAAFPFGKMHLSAGTPVFPKLALGPFS